MSGISPLSDSEEKPLILVADDDKTIREMLCQTMKEEKYRVVEATSSQECIQTYKSMRPDIILLDATKPEMDGFACCKELQKIDRQKLISKIDSLDSDSGINNTVIPNLWGGQTPILMITSNEQKHIVRAFEAGATDYITKPINFTILSYRLRALRKQVQLYKQLESANQALQNLAHIDGLTNLANRRKFDNYLGTQWFKLADKKLPLSLLLCDIDYFKFYNDTYGHPAGDICLQKVGKVLSEQEEKEQGKIFVGRGGGEELVARYGGEEFAVIMPNTE